MHIGLRTPSRAHKLSLCMGQKFGQKKIEANEASDLGAMGSFYKITYHTYKK